MVWGTPDARYGVLLTDNMGLVDDRGRRVPGTYELPYGIAFVQRSGPGTHARISMLGAGLGADALIELRGVIERLAQ